MSADTPDKQVTDLPVNSQGAEADQPWSLEWQIESWNEKLAEAGQVSTNHAFNLAFMIGLIPAGLAVIIILVLFNGKLSAVILAAAIALLAVLAFANMAAFTAGSKAIERVYNQDIYPQITSTLQEHALSYPDLENAVMASPAQAQYLKRCLDNPVEENEPEAQKKE